MIYATAEASWYYTLSLIKDDPLNLLIYGAVICAHREVKWEHFYTLECHHFEISSHYYSGSKSWSAPPLASRAAQASLSEPLRQMVQVKRTKMSASKERVAAGAKKCHRKWTLPAWSSAPCSRHQQRLLRKALQMSTLKKGEALLFSWRGGCTCGSHTPLHDTHTGSRPVGFSSRAEFRFVPVRVRWNRKRGYKQ